MKFAFLIMGNFDSRIDNTAFRNASAQMIGVADICEAYTVARKLYEEFENGNSNINSIIDNLPEDEQNHITMIMAEDYGIDDVEKAIDDIIQTYEREKLEERKYEILEILENQNEQENKKQLEQELNDIIYKLSKIK